jgi:hypothetical protein
MISKIKKLNVSLFLMIGLSLLILCTGYTTEKRDMGGWEKEGKYNRCYDAGDMDDFKGTVLSLKEVIPLPGMSPGVAMEIRVSRKEIVLVHLCPVWFADPKSIGVKKGEKVKVKGAWAEIDGKEVFMASKVKKGEYFEFKLRLTKDGTPFWTMSPEELKRERAQSQQSLKK